MALVILPGLNNLIEDISEEKKLPPNIVEAALREALLKGYEKYRRTFYIGVNEDPFDEEYFSNFDVGLDLDEEGYRILSSKIIVEEVESEDHQISLLEKVANERDLDICGLNIQTNQNPIVVEITIRKTNGDDISLDDCALFNTPASDEIEKSNLLNCSYVLEISSQGVSDELTSERDFKTFKGFPVNVELNQKNSKLKFLNGLLYEKSNDYLAINIKGRIKKIPLDEVLKISLCTLKD